MVVMFQHVCMLLCRTCLVMWLTASYTLKNFSPAGPSYLLNSFATSGQMYPNLSLMVLATSRDCSGGIPLSLSLSSCWMKYVMSRPAIGMCLMQLPITYPSAWGREGEEVSSHVDTRLATDRLMWRTTGMTCVTPSPESMTVPVSVRSPTCLLVHDAANASTA